MTRWPSPLSVRRGHIQADVYLLNVILGHSCVIKVDVLCAGFVFFYCFFFAEVIASHSWKHNFQAVLRDVLVLEHRHAFPDKCAHSGSLISRSLKYPECPSKYNGGNLGFIQTESLLLLFL